MQSHQCLKMFRKKWFQRQIAFWSIRNYLRKARVWALTKIGKLRKYQSGIVEAPPQKQLKAQKKSLSRNAKNKVQMTNFKNTRDRSARCTNLTNLKMEKIIAWLQISKEEKARKSHSKICYLHHQIRALSKQQCSQKYFKFRAMWIKKMTRDLCLRIQLYRDFQTKIEAKANAHQLLCVVLSTQKRKTISLRNYSSNRKFRRILSKISWPNRATELRWITTLKIWYVPTKALSKNHLQNCWEKIYSSLSLVAKRQPSLKITQWILMSQQ